jgi:bud site selection protein 20
VECDRHFPSERDRSVHQKSKLHKREAKRMREEKPYTVEEANWAGGVGVDNRQRTKPVEKIVVDKESEAS